MDIMELGAIGELVGGVAVIASLLFVGFQVRQSAEQTRQNNAIEMARAHREMERALADVFGRVDERLVELYRNALVDFRALPRNDQALLHHRYLIPIGLSITTTFHAGNSGQVDKAWADGFVEYWARVVHRTGLSYWWDQMKGEFHPEFTAAVERLRGDPDVNVITDMQTWLLPDATPNEA